MRSVCEATEKQGVTVLFFEIHSDYTPSQHLLIVPQHFGRSHNFCDLGKNNYKHIDGSIYVESAICR
jgi:hypothetical protein